MIKTMEKVGIIFLTVILVMAIFATEGYCSDKIAKDIENITSGMKGSDSTGGIGSDNKIVKGVNVIYTLIRVAGTGIALLMIMVLGMKYMYTSIEEKAEIKKQAVPIVVGSALIFASSQILAMVAKIVLE